MHMNEGVPIDPLEDFMSILPEGLSPEARKDLEEKTGQRLDAGEPVDNLKAEYLAKRDTATEGVTEKIAKIDGSGIVSGVEDVE